MPVLRMAPQSKAVPHWPYALRAALRLTGVSAPLVRTMVTLLVVVSGCSAPELDGLRYACSTDEDCETGYLCVETKARLACQPVDATPIEVGMTAPLQGPSQGLGIEMRRGIEAAFAQMNDQGGVHGRKLVLRCLNDNYDPELAHDNMVELLDIREEVNEPDAPDKRGSDSVFAILGNVGTPTMLRTAPVATKNQVVFFAPFTGSQAYLRDGTNSPYVFNYRAGYYEEVEAMVDYLYRFRQPRVISDPPGESFRHILAFTQRDAFGDAGYQGLITAYNKIAPLPQPDSSQPEPSIARVYYEREDVASVEPAIAQTQSLLSNILDEADVDTRESVAILMVDTYQPGNKFIRAIKDWLNADVARAKQLDVLFMHVSFVGSDSLSAALVSAPETYVDIRDGASVLSYAEGVIVTQVVPYYASQAEGVKAYRQGLASSDGGAQSFTSLEGYIAAQLFMEALQRTGPHLSTVNLLDTLNHDMVEVDLGLGVPLAFTPTDHQASHTVWGTELQADGSFDVLFTWDPVGRIRAD